MHAFTSKFDGREKIVISHFRTTLSRHRLHFARAVRHLAHAGHHCLHVTSERCDEVVATLGLRAIRIPVRNRWRRSVINDYLAPFA